MQEIEAKPIKILGISGSPRNMATDFLVQEALRIARDKYGAETDYFSAKGKKMNFCIHCDYCIRTKEGCVHKDDIAKNPKVLLNKVGMGIADGGDRIGGQEPSIQTILNFYVISEMIPIGGGSFGANLGATFWSQDKGSEGVSEDSEGIRSLRKTLKKLVQTTQLVKKATEA